MHHVWYWLSINALSILLSMMTDSFIFNSWYQGENYQNFEDVKQQTLAVVSQGEKTVCNQLAVSQEVLCKVDVCISGTVSTVLWGCHAKVVNIH